MSKELEKKIDDLEELIKKTAETPKSKSPSWVRFVGPLITILVLGSTGVAGWATNKAAVSQLEKSVTKMESSNERRDVRIQDVELKAVRDSSDVKHIKEKVDQIQKDIKELLGR